MPMKAQCADVKCSVAMTMYELEIAIELNELDEILSDNV